MNDDTQPQTTDRSRSHPFTGAIVFIICFVIACMFLYWAVEYYVYNNFDHKRYTLSQIQVGNSDTLSVWKLDNRTGSLSYCTKSYNKIDDFVCVHPTEVDAKEYSKQAEAPEHVAPAPEPAAPAHPVPNVQTETAPAITPPAAPQH